MPSAVLQRRDSGEAFDQYSNHYCGGKTAIQRGRDLCLGLGREEISSGAPYRVQPKLVLEGKRHFKRMTYNSSTQCPHRKYKSSAPINERGKCHGRQ